MYRKYIKRIIDFTISLLGLILFSPIFIVFIILLSISNNGKPFFFQKRPGMNEKPFKIFKFKTMNDAKDNKGILLSDAERITKIGKFVRKVSIDELPQLLNVLKGDMSLVGPRPLLPEYLPLYNDFQRRRHEEKPGITGWAQVNGRNAISWDEKFEYDIWYINNISFKLDSKILLLTLSKVIKKEGIDSENSVSMEKFKGN